MSHRKQSARSTTDTQATQAEESTQSLMATLYGLTDEQLKERLNDAFSGFTFDLAYTHAIKDEQNHEEHEKMVQPLLNWISDTAKKRGEVISKEDALQCASNWKNGQVVQYLWFRFVEREFGDRTPLRKFVVDHRWWNQALNRFTHLTFEELFHMGSSPSRKKQWERLTYNAAQSGPNAHNNMHRLRRWFIGTEDSVRIEWIIRKTGIPLSQKEKSELRKGIVSSGNDALLNWLTKKMGISLSKKDQRRLGENIINKYLGERSLTKTIRILKKNDLYGAHLHTHFFEKAIERQFRYGAIQSLARKLGVNPTIEQWRTFLMNQNSRSHSAIKGVEKLWQKYPSLRPSTYSFFETARNRCLESGMIHDADRCGKRCNMPLTAEEIYDALRKDKTLRKEESLQDLFIKRLRQEEAAAKRAA